jgi:hypothetical protein
MACLLVPKQTFGRVDLWLGYNSFGVNFLAISPPYHTGGVALMLKNNKMVVTAPLCQTTTGIPFMFVAWCRNSNSVWLGRWW